MANKVYTIHTATWETDEDKDDVTIDNIVTIAPVIGGDAQTWFADGNIYPEFAWLENVSETVRIQSSNLSLFQDSVSSALEIGDTGILKIWFPQRAEGVGGKSAVASSWLQAICGGPVQTDGCMINQISPAAQQAGANAMDIDFQLTSEDGTTEPIALTLVNAQ